MSINKASRCFSAKSHISGLLTLLEGRGWLRREPDPTDARAKRLYLEPMGERVAAQTAAVQAAVVGGACALLQWATAPALPALPQVASFWWACAYLVAGCTVFAFFAQNWALRHSSPSRVALLTGTEPVWGALFAVAWLGESLGPQGWLGGALVVGAALWMARR